jgi:hypothetical protein
LVGFTDNGNFEENSENNINNIYAIDLINGKKYSSENNEEEILFDKNNIIKEENICVYLMLKNKKFYFKINNEDYKLAFDLKKR